MKPRIASFLRLVMLSLAVPALAVSSDSADGPKDIQEDLQKPLLVGLATRSTDEVSSQRPAIKTVSESARGMLPQREPYRGVDENIFKGHNWYTPPPPPPKRVVVKPVERKPVAPPLPFELLGTFEQAGSPTTYFLVKDDRIYEATIGETLENTYTVDAISNGQLMFTYLPLNTSQGLRLGEQK